MANKWNQHPKLPRCCASLYQGDCLKTPSSHISEETQVVKAVLLLKVWDLFKMVFVSTATIFKCAEKCQELYEKLSMFPLPRIRTPTSPIFAPGHLLLCPCCCLSIWKHVPYHVIFPPPTGVSLKKKKNNRFYNHNFIFVPNHINRDSLEPVLPRWCPEFKSVIFKLHQWKCGLRGREWCPRAR